jgi:DNA-binding response OmpR family regulator
MSVPGPSGDVLSLDLIVIDRNMPGGSGVEAVRAMRAIGVGTPVIMVTSEAGVDAYLCKPFAGAALVAEVRRLLAAGKESAGGGDGDPGGAGEPRH